MFVYTSLALLAAAVGAMVFGATRYIRKNRLAILLKFQKKWR